MNAYNNITWESDRLEYEEGHSPYGNTLYAIVGIPSKPRKGMHHVSTCSHDLTLTIADVEYQD